MRQLKYVLLHFFVGFPVVLFLLRNAPAGKRQLEAEDLVEDVHNYKSYM
jgi:hypothetical protein